MVGMSEYGFDFVLSIKVNIGALSSVALSQDMAGCSMEEERPIESIGKLQNPTARWRSIINQTGSVSTWKRALQGLRKPLRSSSAAGR